MNFLNTFKTDVLVVGGGGAALRAALAANDKGSDVIIAIKGEKYKSGATYYSVAEVGAFNVPDGAGDPTDSPEKFYEDIIHAAQEMADPKLARILSNEAISALEYLTGLGVVFEKDEKYLTFKACFSTKSRAHVIKNHFKPIMKALGREINRRSIKVLDRLMVTDLIVKNGQCFGAYALDHLGKKVILLAKATVIATGGASQLFETNLYPTDVTGDGYAAAYRAGADLTNMEFIQMGISTISPFLNLFGNYLWAATPNISNRYGENFLPQYFDGNLDYNEICLEKQNHFPFSSSDISRFIEVGVQKEINKGNGTENGGVFLDFSETPFEKLLADKSSSISKMWPLTHQWYLERGVDLYKEKVEIACSAHAINGGVQIDENGMSSINNLFAAGEVAAGPHGADRLGGNMALTCQVFGARAGKAASEYAKQSVHLKIGGTDEERNLMVQSFRGKGKYSLEDLKKRLQKAANNGLLVIREKKGILRFLEELKEIHHILYKDSSVTNSEEEKMALEIRNLLDVGEMIALAALVRQESRGSHYREDYPSKNKKYEKNIILNKNSTDGYFMGRLSTLDSTITHGDTHDLTND